MSIAYWTLVIMTLFPYCFAAMAKYGKNYDNHLPRVYLSKLSGWQERANYIQQNSFEIFPLFAVAIIVSQLLANNLSVQDSIDRTALFFVVSRIAYAIAYLKDKPPLRSLFWALGFFSILYLYYLAACVA